MPLIGPAIDHTLLTLGTPVGDQFTVELSGDTEWMTAEYYLETLRDVRSLFPDAVHVRFTAPSVNLGDPLGLRGRCDVRMRDGSETCIHLAAQTIPFTDLPPYGSKLKAATPTNPYVLEVT